MSEARRIYAEAYALGMKPDPILTVSAWADRDRYVGSDESAVPGPWRTSRTPYLRQIMDDLSPSSPVQRVVFMKPARIGGSEVWKNALGHAIVCAPAGVLLVLPTNPDAKAQSKENVKPMFRNTPALRERVAESKARDGRATIDYTEFPGGRLIIVGAQSVSALSNRTVRLVLCDQVDQWPDDVQGQGDPLGHAELRCSSYGRRRKIYITGPPSVRGRSRIYRELMKTDVRKQYLPCPACGHMDYLTWNGKDWFDASTGHHHSIFWGEDPPEQARMLCSGCGELIDETWKPQMLDRAEWRPTRTPTPQDLITTGYHLSSVYSPSDWLTWGQMAREFVDKHHDPTTHQIWVNQRAGEPWEERAERVAEPHELLRPYKPDGSGGLVEVYGKGVRVPAGVGILIAAVDKQQSWLEVVVKGYGAGDESWLIDWERIPGDTSRDEIWLELDQYLRTTFRHASGREIRIEGVAVDARFEPDNVYKFCKAREARRFPDGFEQRVCAVQGGKQVGVPLVVSMSKKNRYNCKVWSLCTDTGKKKVYSRLRIPRPGPGYMHLPDWTPLEYVEGLTAEKRIPRSGEMVWEKIRSRNEPLDCEVYALACLDILGPVVRGNLARRAALFNQPPPETPPAPAGGKPRPPQPNRPLTGAPRGGWMSRVKR